MIRPLLPAVALAALLVLAGCSSPTSGSPASPAASAPQTSLPPSPEDTSTPTPEPDAQWGVNCTTNGEDESFDIYQAAWVAKRAGEKFYECDGVQLTTGPESSTVAAALKAAKYEDDDPSTLFGMCATLNDSYYSMKDYTESQINELTGMLIICPDHPKAKSITARFGPARKIAEARANGERFFSGTYRVGKQIKPGRYVVKGDLDGCYWERLDKAGNIIANIFMSGGTRAEVTIAATDYSFVNQDCGEFVLQK